MHPKDIVPFFPVEDALWVNLEKLGDLVAGDDEGLGIDAAT